MNADGDEEEESGIGVILEKNVTVEAGAMVEAKFVGEGTTIELGARIGKGAILGKVGTTSCFMDIWMLRTGAIALQGHTVVCYCSWREPARFHCSLWPVRAPYREAWLGGIEKEGA